LCGTALALGCGRPAPAAPDFAPTRFSVEVRGSGPDVILIPGLASGRGIWAQTVRAVPGYRYHLIHVHGFAGAPARGNRSGAIVSPLADEVARYIQERRLRRPAAGSWSSTYCRSPPGWSAAARPEWARSPTASSPPTAAAAWSVR